jgi:signal transduction histidine kinase/DNA-binding response OmpR family regulator/ligand-binding sensor domain-containing protein
MGKLFDADMQMSSSFTTQIYMDRDGFIWVATRNGLNRYDGYQFHILKKETRQDLGMASNYVNCIMQDRDGRFYIGMYGALQTYDGQRFHDVQTYDLEGKSSPNYITCLLQRQNGDVLVGTSGHGLLRMTDRHSARQIGHELGVLKTIHNMIEDRHQRVWMTTERRGLWCYDDKKITRYFDDDEMRTSMIDVCEDSEGRIYVSTANRGLFRIDGDTPVHIEGTGSKHISRLYPNRHGQIMLGYDGMGLGVYDPATGELTDNPYFSSEIDLSKSKVYSICEDTNGNVWLGLLQKGVYMEPGHTMGFGYMGYKLGSRNILGTACVTSVRGSANYHYTGTDKDGLYVQDKDNHVVKHFKEHFPATVLSISEDQHGRIWIGSYKEGCGWIDQKTLTYHPYRLPQGPGVSVFDIECDKDGHVWLGTMGNGLLRLGENGDIKAYLQAEGSTEDAKINSITNNYISNLSLSPDGKRIYVATTMGVCAMDIATENWVSTFGKNCLNYGTPVRIAREFDGVLYLGTNNGLQSYDLKSHNLYTHNTEGGLADNGIASIEQDRQGRLWISTDHGLFCMDRKNKSIRSYFVDNGLQSNEFSDEASWVTPDGRMVFGGLGGVTYFNPDEIQEREWKAEVKLTEFSVNGESVNRATQSGRWHVVDTTVIAATRFDLSPDDNSFAIQLSTLTYDNPEHIVYRYRINREEWVRLQPGVNEITFSHMAPGTYDFCVVAEQNGISTPERCFTVVIHAPWYRTPFAYIIYILALAALFWWYRWQHHRKEQDRLRLQEHIHAEELADTKLKFFMNISHEIRTPMTLIVTPLMSLIKQDDDPHRRSIYETIRRNAERILGLINQMMDLRKIDKGQMQMQMCETELVSFLGDISSLFSQHAKTKNIVFAYEHDTLELPVWIDRDNFDKIIVNLLSNAFKFTHAGGSITMRMTHDSSNVNISIRDTGEGIPEDKMAHIFERFYQAPLRADERNIGTGIGLDLTRSLVELHHGTISVRNNPEGKGTEFIVTIPLGNSHLKPEEMITDVPEQPKETLMPEESPEQEQAEATQPELPKIGKRQHIVIVEDDTEILDYLKQELSPDYDITACENGRAGLAEILKSIPDLVISDIMMPEMDGKTMCSKVKTSPTTAHIPVIMLTAKSRDEDMLEGLETGADAYLMKPFNMEILRRTIVNLIHTHQMLQLKFGRNDQLEELVDDIEMKTADDKLLERVMNVINKNLSNSDLCVDNIAEEVGISRVHLHRKMKELTGQTPHDFIRNIRLKKAAQLLSSGNRNVSEVMYSCGFSNAASFSTVFKKMYGMSPREFMTEHQKRK